MRNRLEVKPRRAAEILAALFTTLALSGCGGSSSGTDTPSASAQATSVTVPLDASGLPDAQASLVIEPTFHLAPVLLAAPDDRDAQDNTASALTAPHAQALSASQAALNTRGLTVQAIESAQRAQALTTSSGELATPQAGTGTVTTYTPAQIRAAYKLPALPATGTTPTAAQAAQLGAGQTIYIVDAKHDPNVAAELSTFNQKFGLPTCTSRAIATSTKLPLASAATADGCTLSVVYSTASGTMSGTAPLYDSGWATEITLDVQWAHATAPLARIILIEAPDASLNSLLGAIQLANSMGPGVVSMSFGANEGSWISSVDSAFTGAGMSYLAATGDSGAAVYWPAVSSKVVAVGGTSLSYTSTGTRTEAGWSGTGGGISQYLATPSYQASRVPGVGSLIRRGVADVAFNANPSTGQFVAVIPSGSTTASWVSAGGTSLSTPQWAGITAVANAMRVQAGKAVLGAPHAQLYGQIGAVPGTYASAFADITSGTNGACAICTATVGYDALTGLGTPNATSLLSALLGSTAVSTAPVIASATVSGKAGVALAFTVSATAANPVSYALSGAPSGMTIASNGVLSWANPVAGSYAVTVTAKDSKTALSGQGVVTVVIASASQTPVIKASALSGVAGKALTGSISVSDPGGYAMAVTITGLPSGVLLSVSGQTITFYWAKPIKGSYALNISVRDAIGLTAQASVPITIAAQ
jgi:subtilase family serine protease